MIQHYLLLVGIKWNDYIDDVNIKVASEHAMIDAINTA